MSNIIISGMQRVAGKKNLLLLNAILCFCYPFYYILFIVSQPGQDIVNSKLYTLGVTALNVLFLAIMTLNLNTIITAYSILAKPRKKYIRIIYFITLATWILYVSFAFYCTFFVAGFISHFHHYVNYSFRSLGWPMIAISIVFATGLSLLYMEYYARIKMKHILSFIIPAIIHFAFKNTMPFIMCMMAWITYSGCQLLLYFSILDYGWLKKKKVKYPSSTDIILPMNS